MRTLLSYWENDTTKLLIALSLSQLSQFLVILMQTSHYSLGEFGKISLLISLSAILSLVFKAGIVTSISVLIARSQHKIGQPIFALATCLAIISSVIISLLAYLFGKSLEGLLELSLTNDSNIIFLLIGYFILYEYAENLLKGAGLIRLLAALIIATAIIVAALSAILIHLDAKWHVQFLVRSITQGSLSLIVIISLVRSIGIKFSLVKQLARSLKDVGIVIWLSSVAGEISGRINEFALAFFFTPEISGTYKFLLALIAPASLITNAISKTNFRKYSLQSALPLFHVKINNVLTVSILLFTIPIAMFSSYYLKIPITQLLIPAFLVTLTASISSSWNFKLTFLEVHKYGTVILKGGVLMALIHLPAIWLLTSNYELIGALLANVMAALTFMFVISKKYRTVTNVNNKY